MLESDAEEEDAGALMTNGSPLEIAGPESDSVADKAAAARPTVAAPPTIGADEEDTEEEAAADAGVLTITGAAFAK
jgi:hypothetical protein